MKPSLTIVPPDTTANVAPASCPSCHAQADGNFCSRCGEALHAHAPSAHEFAHEFIGHYVALEGKLWGTLRLLLFKPGQLTVDFLRGRRVPTIHPLRLYLTLSLLMFALIKLYGVDLPRLVMDEKSFGVVYTHSVPDPANPKRIGTATIAVSSDDSSPGNPRPVRDAVTRLSKVSASWAANAERFMAAPPAEKAALVNHGVLANLPYMLIGALPLFALYLKLMYLRTRRTYGEHLVFSLHATAFAFLLAIAMILIPGNLAWALLCVYEGLFGMISAWDCLQLLPVLWMLGYLPLALRRVHGGGKWATRGKAAVLVAVHLLVIASLVAGAQVVAILRHA